MGEMRNAYKILVGKPEEKNHLEVLDINRRIVILECLKEIGWEGVVWICMAQDTRDQWIALVNMIMNFQVPQKAGNFFTS
jgi:hypothetical protein